MAGSKQRIETQTHSNGGQKKNLQKERYRVFIEDVADGFYETNLQGDFLFFNDALCRIFGYARTDIRNRNFRTFMDKKNAEIAFESFNRIYKTEKKTTDIVWEIIHSDGRTRILEISANPIYDENGEKSGFRGIARDITEKHLAQTEAKRVARSNKTLFRVAEAIHHYSGLDGLLAFITREIQNLMRCEGALVILVDEKRNEFFFRAAAYDDSMAEKKFKETRFPIDKGVAGQVYRTGKPMRVHDYYKSPYSHLEIDRQTGSKTRNMLQVPMWIEDRMIGALCAVNKKEGPFEDDDVALLGTTAGMVALPIENARINHELQASYDEVKSLNRAKDRFIHHLSHELKTPVSVLAASLSVLNKKYVGREDKDLSRILDRAQRNLDRILDMQYEIEDILSERDYKSYSLLSALLAACSDELELLAVEETGRLDIIPRIRRRIETLFGPRDYPADEIELSHFVAHKIKLLQHLSAHRQCRLKKHFEPTPAISIPVEVLSKIVEGLIRNAVENTPDEGLIQVSVKNGLMGPELEIKDFGVGITAENRNLIFESYLTTHDTLQYSSRKPYDFYAGGKGFDLLRMKIFSEQYGFQIHMASKRCIYIPRDEDLCPGKITKCRFCRVTEDCIQSGGTTMTVRFTAFKSKAKLTERAEKTDGK